MLPPALPHNENCCKPCVFLDNWVRGGIFSIPPIYPNTKEGLSMLARFKSSANPISAGLAGGTDSTRPITEILTEHLYGESPNGHGEGLATPEDQNGISCKNGYIECPTSNMERGTWKVQPLNPEPLNLERVLTAKRGDKPWQEF
jgi:hypothetical protein